MLSMRPSIRGWFSMTAMSCMPSTILLRLFHPTSGGPFAAPEPPRGLRLFPLLEEPPHVLGLEVEVVGVGLGPELHLFHLDRRLLLACVLLPPGLHVLELPEVHDPADRRLRLPRHLHQVHVPLGRAIGGLLAL